jgi:hypothetical protein
MLHLDLEKFSRSIALATINLSDPERKLSPLKNYITAVSYVCRSTRVLFIFVQGNFCRHLHRFIFLSFVDDIENDPLNTEKKREREWSTVPNFVILLIS